MIHYEVPIITDPKIIDKEVLVSHSGMKYRVLKYDDKYVCDDDVKMGIYRSVVYSEEGGLLSYSCPKSESMNLFTEKNPTLGDDILVTEVVEGTMMSLFWDGRIGGWELATRGAVSGNYWFYRNQYDNEKENQKTFRDMFLEVLQVEDFKSEVFSLLPKGNEYIRMCYTFVLQHPDNHIVLKIHAPRLVLVSVYGICKDTNIAEYVPYEDYKSWNVWQELAPMIDFPIELSRFETVEEYRQNYCLEHSPNHLPGVMFLCKKTGERACLENPAYAELKQLRGNNPNLHYQYLCLLRIGKVADFLTHFPQYKRLFGRFRQQWDTFVTNIHQAYLSYFIRPFIKGSDESDQLPGATRPLISKRYFPLIHKLHHEVYLPSLSQTKIIMKRPIVFKHLLEFPPSTLFHYLYMIEEPE